MYFIYVLIEYLIFFQFFFSIGLGEDNYFSLVINRKNGNLALANPYEMEAVTYKSSFAASCGEKLFHFCPIPTTNTYEVKTIGNGKGKTTDQKICQSVADPTFAKVLNPGQLKQNWNNDIELYHSGFKVDISKFSKRSGLKIPNYFNCYEEKQETESKKDDEPLYELLNREHYKLVLGIKIYFSKIIQQTVAVKYKLLSSPVFAEGVDESVHKYKEMAQLKIPKFLEYLKKKEYYLESIVKNIDQQTEKTAAIIDDSKLRLDQFTFAPSEHFQLPMWRIPIRIIPNITPVSHRSYSLWYKVDIFARLAAKYFGDFEVTSGITWLTESKKAVIGDQEFEFFIPDYFWKVFEFRDKKSYAILVVLHSGLLEDNTPQMCQDICETNGWPVSNSNSDFGKIYCCELTISNIEQLRVPFLNLEERLVFNLNNPKWKEKKKKLEKDELYKSYTLIL